MGLFARPQNFPGTDDRAVAGPSRVRGR